MNVWARVHRAGEQWAVVSCSCLPASMEVIGHDVDEVQVTVDFKRFFLDQQQKKWDHFFKNMV